jgi:hypothetical protein
VSEIRRLCPYCGSPWDWSRRIYRCGTEGEYAPMPPHGRQTWACYKISRLRDALGPFIDDDPCVFDHHGGCQTHDPNEGTAECRVAVARRVMGLSVHG